MSRPAPSPLWLAIDRATDSGRTLDIWWRDDDAVRHTAALDRLLALAARTGCPVSVAVVPGLVERSLVDRLADEPAATVLAHGLVHANHAPQGEKPAEFGRRRSFDEAQAELREAARITGAAFGQRAAPVFVPPWNRIAPELADDLPRLGFQALSAFGAPVRSRGDNEAHRVDTHLDPVAWPGDRGLVPPEALAAAATRAVEGGTTALGLLTHHLVFDEALWRFTETFLEEATRRPGIRLRTAAELLKSPGPSSARRDERCSSVPEPDSELAA